MDTIRAAPNFSSAYSSLAQISNLMHIAQPGVYRTRERERETIDLGRMAVRLDPLDSRAHLSLGWAYMMAKQYEQAPTHFDLACQLNDSDPWTLISASLAHSFSGSSERAKELAKLAFDLSLVTSRTMWGYDVTSRFLWGDYEGCVGAARRASDVIVNLPAWTAAALHHLGRRRMPVRSAQVHGSRQCQLARFRAGNRRSDCELGAPLVSDFQSRRLGAPARWIEGRRAPRWRHGSPRVVIDATLPALADGIVTDAFGQELQLVLVLHVDGVIVESVPAVEVRQHPPTATLELLDRAVDSFGGRQEKLDGDVVGAWAKSTFSKSCSEKLPPTLAFAICSFSSLTVLGRLLSSRAHEITRLPQLS